MVWLLRKVRIPLKLLPSKIADYVSLQENTPGSVCVMLKYSCSPLLKSHQSAIMLMRKRKILPKKLDLRRTKNPK